MFGIFASILLFGLFQDLPYKPGEEFEIKLDLSFRQRPSSSMTEVNFVETRSEYERRTSATPIPYLQLKIILSDVKENETRLKIVRDHTEQIYSKKKLVDGYELLLDMGFVDDLKDQVKGHHHEITFYDDKRKEVSRIVIEFDRDGTYLVNGEVRGKL